MKAIPTSVMLVWRPLSEAVRDTHTSYLVFMPTCAASIFTRGLHLMRWSGWGGGVWEDVHSGWRPADHELIGAIYTTFETLSVTAKEAAVLLRPEVTP